MDIFSFPQAKGIVVSGDIHGDFKQLVHKCCIQYGMTLLEIAVLVFIPQIITRTYI